MTPADGHRLLLVPRPAELPEPGRCIYCDQRCDAKEFFHSYCLELHQGCVSSSLLSQLIHDEETTPRMRPQDSPGTEEFSGDAWSGIKPSGR